MGPPTRHPHRTDDRNGGRSPTRRVASYLAKYATKSTEAIGAVAARITAATLAIYGSQQPTRAGSSPPPGRLGHHPHEDFQALRRWAHMLGFRGHFSTKSRRYSTTLRALRTARATWRRRQTPRRQPTRGNHPRRHRPELPGPRLAHHRRRIPRSVRRRPRPRTPAHRPRRIRLHALTPEGDNRS